MATQVNEQQRMVDLTRVSKTYPPNVQALTDISLQILRGEILFLTGMSGAGKTTLLRLICGIEKPNKGFIEVAGQDLNKISRAKIQLLRRHIGVVYQNFKLLPDRTVAENIALSMEVDYRSRIFIRKQTKDLLAQLHLEDKYNTKAHKLSRGEQQRVAIARAVANKPDLILADEPTGNLDAETTQLVMDLFLRCNNSGTTLLVATHDRSIYNRPDSTIVKLSNGRFTPDERTTTGDPMPSAQQPSAEERK
jgi:cell division transport system ATP-binding protein